VTSKPHVLREIRKMAQNLRTRRRFGMDL
jgi:hypothetical protein